MKLKSGMEAPDIVYHDYLKKEFALSGLRGDKVLLSFYRYAGCPFCQLRFMELSDRYGERTDLQLVAVFQSPAESIREHAAGNEDTTTVIGDAAERFYKVYGVDFGLRAWVMGIQSAFRYYKSLSRGNKQGQKEGQKNRIPADFLIDEDGILRHVYYGKHMDDHMPIDWIEKFLEI